MRMKIRAAGAAAFLLVSLPACQDQPTASPLAGAPPGAATVLAELRCDVDVVAGTLSCRQAAESGGATGARRSLVTVGGQHHYVRLANSGNTTDAGAGTFTTTVTVQNLLLAALGTMDGVTPHASGVRVFFASGPTNGVAVANATGQAFFLAAGQDYFQYSGVELGADGVLRPDETSAGKPWTFSTNGAISFSFVVNVQGAVPNGAAHTAHFVQLSAGDEHTCALTAQGKAYCWGDDRLGQLGNGDAATGHQGVPFPVEMPAGVSFTRISAGQLYTCALTSDGLAYCWGLDNFDKLGNGATLTDPQTRPHPVEMPDGVRFSSISAGSYHTCALTPGGQAYCWGSDLQGELGDGGPMAFSQAVPTPVQMPAGTSFTSVVVGGSHTCALAAGGHAYCWGSDGGGMGQLGNGAFTTSDQPAPVSVQMPAGADFTTLAAGYSHTCASGADGRAWCWGNDRNRQLGNGAAQTADQPTPYPVQIPAGSAFTSVFAGPFYTCALASAGQAYCWGSDAEGGLGNGPVLTDDQAVPSPVQVPAGVGFTQIVPGARHNCALGAGPSYCWGSNGSRGIGDGTGLTRHAPVVVAGTR